MNAPANLHPAAPSASPGQRWRAAQRLAQGDNVQQAAGWADLPVATIESLRGEAGFREQVRAEVELLAMPDEAWAERLKGQMRQAVERALAEGKVSTVNLLLRTSLVLPALARGAPATRAALAARVADADLDAAPRPTEPADPLPEPDPAVDLPVVEADPEREARRRAILAGVKPILRPDLGGAGLDLLEQYAAATDPDPAVYEAWFAAQPKVPAEPVALGEEDLAAIRHVTRHNPPWLRGEYLGYYRAPVPREAFAQDAAGTVATRAEHEPDEPPSFPPTPALPARDPLPELRARLDRLLDRQAPRLPDELDLAEAVCAVRWPNWPGYAGPTDLGLLRLALQGRSIDDDTLHWLGSHELAQACRAPTAREPPAA